MPITMFSNVDDGLDANQRHRGHFITNIDANDERMSAVTRSPATGDTWSTIGLRNQEHLSTNQQARLTLWWSPTTRPGRLRFYLWSKLA